MVRNGELRVLLGYEREMGKDFTAALQWYLEHVAGYGSYQASLPKGAPAADRDRQVLTMRLTRLLLRQNLKLSLFTYLCPTDEDLCLRPRVHYKLSDHWSVELGGNVFWGRQPWTFFGQLEHNSNVYVGIRYGFVAR